LTEKLKYREIKAYREKQLKKQKGLCGLCGQPCSLEEAAQDHDHKTGHMRDVLHTPCNAVEGKIFYWANRLGGRMEVSELFAKLLEYRARNYTKSPIHPTHGRKRKRRRKKK